MKQIRFLIIGIVFGGGFGAKIGAYLSQFFGGNIPFQMIEFGFVLGASVGLLISLIFQVMNSGAFERQKETSASVTLAT